MTHAIIITIMALAALGVWTAMGQGMILHRYHVWASTHLPAWAFFMTAECSRCMVTIYGTSAALALGFTFPLWYWPVYLVAAVGLQEMLHR
jgi:hypothetical protein